LATALIANLSGFREYHRQSGSYSVWLVVGWRAYCGGLVLPLAFSARGGPTNARRRRVLRARHLGSSAVVVMLGHHSFFCVANPKIRMMSPGARATPHNVVIMYVPWLLSRPHARTKRIAQHAQARACPRILTHLFIYFFPRTD
jgi:hypothetical protein